MTRVTGDQLECAVSPSLDSYPEEAVELGKLVVTDTLDRSKARICAKVGDVAPVLGGTMPPMLLGGPADRPCGQGATIESDAFSTGMSGRGARGQRGQPDHG